MHFGSKSSYMTQLTKIKNIGHDHNAKSLLTQLDYLAASMAIHLMKFINVAVAYHWHKPWTRGMLSFLPQLILDL